MKHLNESTKKYPNLKPWIISYKNRTIAYAHCTCMAGLGEVCSHAAAIAFALYSVSGMCQKNLLNQKKNERY